MQGTKAKQMIQKAIFDELVRLVDPGDSAPPAFNVRLSSPLFPVPYARRRRLNQGIPMPRSRSRANPKSS